MTLSTREAGLLSNTDVLGYIQAENARVNALAKAEGWQFWTLMAEELAEEFANAYELELMFARNAYSDTHKDWCGCRSKVSDELTLEQVEAEASQISEWAAQEAADQIAEDCREEYWVDLEREEEEMRLLQLRRDAEEAEDVLWDIQDRIMGVA